MAAYLKTFTGKKVDALEPQADTIDLRDIAHALSLLCRGNGQVTHFYSVGQHCVNAAKEAELRGYTVRLQFLCLLHDAAESYVSDLIRPVKQYLPEFDKIENNFLKAIFEHFELGEVTAEEWKLVKEVDDDLLVYDLVYLLQEPVSERGFRCLRNPDIDYVDPVLIEKEYIDIAEKLIKSL